ncbi:HAD family hydrolase [Azospirillaceae bacterium]
MTSFIFFDIGATLVEGPSQTPARQFAARFGWSDSHRKKIDRYLLTHEVASPEALAHLLISDYDVCFADAQSAAEDVWATQNYGAQAIAGASDLLAELRRQKIPYGFISNIWFPYAKRFCALFGDLVSPETCFFSFRQGVAKPDKELYLYALNVLERRAGECVMVGDSYDNDIGPALALGMRAIWVLHRYGKEQAFQRQVMDGLLPHPDLTVSRIADLSPSLILRTLYERP